MNYDFSFFFIFNGAFVENKWYDCKESEKKTFDYVCVLLLSLVGFVLILMLKKQFFVAFILSHGSIATVYWFFFIANRNLLLWFYVFASLYAKLRQYTHIKKAPSIQTYTNFGYRYGFASAALFIDKYYFYSRFGTIAGWLL